MHNTDTICAIATAPGGAIGIIRISGPHAISAVDTLFRPIGHGRPLAERKPYTLAYGTLVDNEGHAIDEVLCSLFRAPHSYTGDDAVELSCHGSSYIMQHIMQQLTQCGCRMAGPGEFTQRAFLNGKLDLSQAEAVADLISATNKATHDMALSQLKGHFSSELAQLRSQLLELTSLLELELDFSDHEELEFADRTQLRTLALRLHQRLATLASSFEVGNALKQGIAVAIVGKTNVGKSTLLNRLVHDDKAIVSDVHGTTRDYIEDVATIHGIQFRFVDTAGLRTTTDTVERIGIERSYQKLHESRIALWLIDQMPTAAEAADICQHVAGKPLIVATNKIDQPGALTPSCLSMLSAQLEQMAPGIRLSIVGISAKHGTGIDQLEQALVAAADLPHISESDIVVTSLRHYTALQRADECLEQVLNAMDMGLSADLLAEHLRMALAELGEITGGQIQSQETLNNIFKNFCIGK